MTPDWLARPHRVFLLESYFPPFHPRLEYDPEATVARVADMGCDVLRFGTIGKWALYPSAFMPQHPELGGRDLVLPTRNLARERGLRFAAYVPTCHTLPLAITDGLRPEWTRRATPEGEPAPAFGQFGNLVRPICWASPYRAAFEGIVREVVERFDPDALYFDSWRTQYFASRAPGLDHPVCYCAGCQAQFGEIPHRPDGRYTEAERARLRDYAAWYVDLTHAAFQGARALADAHGLPMLVNRYLRSTPWDQRVLRGHEGVLFESHPELVARVEGIGLGTARGQTVWQYVGNYDSWPRLVPPGDVATAQEAVTSAAFGAQPAVAAGNRLLYGDAPALRAAMGALAELTDRIGPFAPTRWAAVVAGGNDQALHGVMRALLDHQLPVETIDRTDVERVDLARYAVIVLPDVAELSAEAIAALRAYRGGLVALGRVAAPDLVGCEVLETGFVPPDNMAWGRPWDVYLQDREQETDGRRLPVPAFQRIAPGPETTVHAWVVAVGADADTTYPGVVRYGRAAYVTADMGAIYETTRHRGVGDLIADVARAVAAAPPPVEVRGPVGLAVSVVEGPRGRAALAVNHAVGAVDLLEGRLVIQGRALPVPPTYAIHALEG